MPRIESPLKKPWPLHRVVMAAVICLPLSGCGQTGPLYLPAPDEERGGMSAAVAATVTTVASE